MRPAFVKEPLFRKGLRIRRQVIGADYVARRLKAANDYTWPFEELATKTAWGMIWSRPGLPRKTRSFLNLAALTAMNMRDELRLHIRAALRNGLSRKEIAETLLHCAIYCGYPKAVDALRLMGEVFAQVDAEKPRKGPKKRAARR
ncbi:MAG: 4-carboxymuconolactone decarboxylase [Betaproteobacteria bacterium]|nr:4-carboxymuconolactone decarboxylase [Betaproteobacteria bacterium]